MPVSKHSSTAMRLRSLTSDLGLDGVLTLNQVSRHYEVTSEVIRASFPTQVMQSKVLNSSAPTELMTFVALSAEDLQWTPAWRLAHQAGTAELRRALGARRSEWQLEQTIGTHRADATWHRPDGQVWAVEYDPGYLAAKVRAKLGAFDEGYDAVRWGTSSRVRTSHLEHQHAAPHRTFLTVSL